MKFVTVRYNDEEITGVLLEGRGIAPMEGCNLPYRTINEFIANVTEYEMNFLQRISQEYHDLIPLDEVEFCAPIPDLKQDVICLGLNYLEHMKSAQNYSKGALLTKENDPAVYFSKRVTVPSGDGADVYLPFDLAHDFDYEVELGVVIGRDAYRVKKEDAKDYVFGYTIINDMTAREIQFSHKQWYYGKSLDGFTPMGPSIVSADEFSFPPVLTMESRVNGELRQHGSTKDMIHSIPEIIEDLSQGMTLKAGTVIATGTPKGTAMEKEKPIFLKAGDVVTCSIQGIGTLTSVMTDQK